MSISRPIATALAAAGLAGVLVFGLSACSPEPAPKPSPTPSASAEPIFASDEEALAAAVKAYEAYLAKVDALTADGGEDAESIREYVTASYADELIESLNALHESGNHTSGRSLVDRTSLVKANETGGFAKVSMYACLDVSGIRVLSEEGKDVTPSDRPERRPLQVDFESDPNDASRLLPSGTETWPGDDFCN